MLNLGGKQEIICRCATTGLAVIFITPLTLFLAEASSALRADPSVLIYSRGLDVRVLGSLIGAVGGWFVHHEQLHKRAERQFRKTRVALLRGRD